MNKGYYAIAAMGVLAALAGFVFALQGLGIVGPQSSFMYRNPLWVYQGSATVVIGLVLAVLSLLARRRIRSSKGITTG